MIKIEVAIKTPPVPTHVEVTTFQHPTLDAAFANNGKGLMIDIADLDEAALDDIVRQWRDALKSAAKERAGRRKGAPMAPQVPTWNPTPRS